VYFFDTAAGVLCKVAHPVMEKVISRIRKRNKTNHRLEFIHTVVFAGFIT